MSAELDQTRAKLDQDDVNGNPFERHVDHWGYEDMREQLMPGVVKTWCGDVLAYYLWSAEAARKHVRHDQEDGNAQ
jgi:hypothetical protein